MSNIIYKNWGFRFAIWIVIIFVLQFVITINFNSLTYDVMHFAKVMGYFGMISLLLFLMLLLFLILSLVNGENKDYKFWIAAVVCVLYGLQFVAALFYVIPV